MISQRPGHPESEQVRTRSVTIDCDPAPCSALLQPYGWSYFHVECEPMDPVAISVRVIEKDSGQDRLRRVAPTPSRNQHSRRRTGGELLPSMLLAGGVGSRVNFA